MSLWIPGMLKMIQYFSKKSQKGLKASREYSKKLFGNFNQITSTSVSSSANQSKESSKKGKDALEEREQRLV
jgi:hypothetical protein